MINKFEFDKLLHDLKSTGKVIDLISEEKNPDKRKLIADLIRDELDRLHQDISEMKNSKKENK